MIVAYRIWWKHSEKLCENYIHVNTRLNETGALGEQTPRQKRKLFYGRSYIISCCEKLVSVKEKAGSSFVSKAFARPWVAKSGWSGPENRRRAANLKV